MMENINISMERKAKHTHIPIQCYQIEYNNQQVDIHLIH